MPACPGCGMIKNEWPGEGYTHEGETYCCQGCAEGTGCTCITVGKPGFSRQGQKLTKAEPRPGEQRSQALEDVDNLAGRYRFRSRTRPAVSSYLMLMQERPQVDGEVAIDVHGQRPALASSRLFSEIEHRPEAGAVVGRSALAFGLAFLA